MNIMTLDLRERLPFSAGSLENPFEAGEPGEPGELMARFELSGEAAGALEPETATYLPRPAFIGRADPAAPEGIPAGSYLFAQAKRQLDQTGFTAMAIEVQKEGLWRGLDLAHRLYLRILTEEEGIVTQVFRPIEGGV